MINELMIRKNDYKNRSPLEKFILDSGAMCSMMPEEAVEGMCKLSLQLICPSNEMNEDELKEMEMKVVNAYIESANTFNHADGVVAFADVYDLISERNQDIFDELAKIEYHHCGQEDDYREFNGLGPDDEIEFDEALCHMYGEWADHYYTSVFSFESLDEYIMFVLNKYKLAYSFENNDIPYDHSNAGNVIFKIKEVSFIANDCQNVLNPELMFMGFAGHSDYINFHEEYKVDTKLLGGAL